MPAYKVEIVEKITEIRELTVEATSFEDAHRKAYVAWVENGQPEGGGQLSVDERTFEITAPDGTYYEGDDDHFKKEPDDGDDEL